MSFKFGIGEVVEDLQTKQICQIIGYSYSAGQIDPHIPAVNRTVYWTDLGHYPSNGRVENQLAKYKGKS